MWVRFPPLALMERIIVYCSCNSVKKGILERMPCNPMKPEGSKWVLPSFICPDCRCHRSLKEIRWEPDSGD